MKKVLFALTVVFVICLFAISVSAIEVDGVYYDIDTNNKVATVNTENRTATTEIATIPSTIEYEGVTYMVTKISNDAFNGNTAVKEIRILSVHIKAIPSGMIMNTYNGALEKIYIDFSNITSIGDAGLNPSDQGNGNNPMINNFYYYDAKAFLKDGSSVVITDPDFSNCTNIGSAAFQGANFEKVTIPAAVTVSNQMFRYSTIKELVIEGENRETIGYYNFHNCKQLKKITIKSRALKSISNDNFATCTAVTEIYIDLSKCQDVGGSTFTFANAYDGGQTRVQWYNLEGEKIVDLSSMKIFREKSFASSNLGSAKIIWPKAIDTLYDQSFRKCNINQPMLIMAAEGKSLKLPYWCFEGNNPTFVLCNEGVTECSARFFGATAVFLASSLNITDSESGFVNGSTLYCKGLAEGSKVPGGDKCTIINITDGTINNYGLCGFTANVTTADGVVNLGSVTHTTSGAIDNTLCPVGKVEVTSCKYCTYKTYSVDGENVEKKEHSYVLVGAIAYENYFELGFKTSKCECGDEKAATEATEAPIFIDYGYSATEGDINGTFAMSQFYGINQEALEAYKAATGNTIEYGLVAAADSDPITNLENGTLDSKKVFVTNADSIALSCFGMRVCGITEEKSDAKIAFCAYIKDGDKLFYLDDGMTVTSVTMKSYNEIMAAIG